MLPLCSFLVQLGLLVNSLVYSLAHFIVVLYRDDNQISVAWGQSISEPRPPMQHAALLFLERGQGSSGRRSSAIVWSPLECSPSVIAPIILLSSRLCCWADSETPFCTYHLLLNLAPITHAT